MGRQQPGDGLHPPLDTAESHLHQLPITYLHDPAHLYRIQEEHGNNCHAISTPITPAGPSHYTHNGIAASAGGGSGALAGRCTPNRATANSADAAMPRNSRQAHGCAQMQVWRKRALQLGTANVLADTSLLRTARLSSRNCEPRPWDRNSTTNSTWLSLMPCDTCPYSSATPTLRTIWQICTSLFSMPETLSLGCI